MDNFTFRFSPLDGDAFLPQISAALEKRTELVSRVQYPGMWKATDSLRASVKEPSRSRRIFRTVLSIFCLACGIFLFIPGLMEPQELRVPLFAGAIGIGAGIGGLWRNRKHKKPKKNRFDKSARLLLAQRAKLSNEQDYRAVFTDAGVTLSVDGEGEDSRKEIPYDGIAYMVETADLLFLYEGESVTVLQKKDLLEGSLEELAAFLSERTAYHKI